MSQTPDPVLDAIEGSGLNALVAGGHDDLRDVLYRLGERAAQFSPVDRALLHAEATAHLEEFGLAEAAKLVDAALAVSRNSAGDRADSTPFTSPAKAQGEALPRTRTLIVGRLADVQPEKVTWLWPGRIPLGKLTMLDGDPGLGKSLASLDLAARVSTGAPMPGGADRRDPAAVIILTAEDGLGDTVRPRLDALGADVSLIHAVVGVKVETGGEQGVTFPMDLDSLQATALQLDARLIVIDPFMAFIGDGVNTRIDHDVRRLLAPLARLADVTGAAVLVIRHLNKSSMGSALYRGGGSIAFIGAARAGLLIARDPDDETRRVLATTKMNLAPEPPSLGFTIETGTGAPCIRWLGETQHKANDLVSGGDEPQEAGDLKGFLRDLLEAAPRSFSEVRTECRKAGFDVSDRSLRRARQALGISVNRQAFGGACTWSLSNGHSGHIPAIVDASQNMSGMSAMGRYDDPDTAARDAMREGA